MKQLVLQQLLLLPHQEEEVEVGPEKKAPEAEVEVEVDPEVEVEVAVGVGEDPPGKVHEQGEVLVHEGAGSLMTRMYTKPGRKSDERKYSLD
ncbi:hypothetical protein J437_LFUL005109 [Ladona fulva]|uniref:Uncharacterized protein n=1 Tax=Ladona fulva TaxID=123851 RepID=A0A8K0JZ83_LADFU|nr:hypothetical protein J437_LFUL005109 [Ladona fulva]